jgi:hypothetical protein
MDGIFFACSSALGFLVVAGVDAVASPFLCNAGIEMVFHELDDAGAILAFAGGEELKGAGDELVLCFV